MQCNQLSNQVIIIIILMQQPRNTKHIQSRKRPIPHQNPQLITAQLPLSRAQPSKNIEAQQSGLIDPLEVLEQAEQLWTGNDNLQSINLLKGLLQYLRTTRTVDASGHHHNQQHLNITIHINLAVSYYKIGFLQQSFDQFASALSIIKEASLSIRSQIWSKGPTPLASISKVFQKLKYDMLTTKIQLQTCILFSEMGKHDLALEHAYASCKTVYNLLVDTQISMYQCLLGILSSKSYSSNPSNASKNNYLINSYAPENEIKLQDPKHANLLNNIAIINELLVNTRDFKKEFIIELGNKSKKSGNPASNGSSEKLELLQQLQKTVYNKYGKLPNKTDIDLLYAIVPENIDALWIFKNKILDEIQMRFVKVEQIGKEAVGDEMGKEKSGCLLTNNQVIEKIVYFVISLYCYSTETRFLEKDREENDPGQVLDSEHWLSRSLEIAYSFLPHEAPILSQILTVHDRFHGIDKQTIPQDKEVGGFFKVLRPLTKPKSVFSSNNKNAMCSPIMIRIQMPNSIHIDPSSSGQMLEYQLEPHEHEHEHGATSYETSGQKRSLNRTQKIELSNKTIDLDITSLTKNNKIRGLSGPKKYDFTEYSQSTIKHKNNTKVDFTEHLKNIYASKRFKPTLDTKSNNINDFSGNMNMKIQKMKINLTGISSNQASEEIKSMRRPHSYDREIDKSILEDHVSIQTERKKKSMSLHKKQRRETSNRPRRNTSNSTGLKLDGLQMLPSSFKRNQDDETFEFSGKISNVEASKLGGNIFINNNINLFISKESLENGGIGHKTMSNKNSGERAVYEIGKRQNFINKRKAHNSMGIKNSEFIL